MKLFTWFPELTLRTLRVVSLGFIVLNSYSIYKGYREGEYNTLVPESLGAYVAFPHYFFIGFYLLILFAIWKFIRGDFLRKRWWWPVVAVMVFESIKFYIYGLLMWVNPFG